MTQTKTKKALLMSVLSMVLCVAMLVGMTFAWFTDTASTGVNKIAAGNLKVKLLDSNNNEISNDASLKWITTDTGEVLWEPNCKYNLESFKIQNAGNLALKYKVVLKATDIDTTGDGKSLLDVIDWKITIGEETLAITSEQIKASLQNGIEIITDRPLAKGHTDDLITVQGHMKAEAGNDYQNLTIGGFGITVYATQDTVEADSYGSDYDEKAEYPVSSQEELDTALADETKKTINLGVGKYSLESTTAINEGVTMSGQGKEKTTVETNKTKISKNDVTLKDMTIKGNAPEGNAGALQIAGKNTTLDTVNFIGQGFNGDTKAISVTGTNTTIKNSRISNAFRGIIFWDNIGGDNLIENCIIDNVIYTFNINAGTVQPGTTLTVKGSTLNGWTSYSGCMSHVTFEKCDLGKSNGYAYLVAYADSTFTECVFNDGYKIAAGATGKTLTLTKCKLGDGTKITAENFAEKLGDVDADMEACTVIIDGVTVTWN